MTGVDMDCESWEAGGHAQGCQAQFEPNLEG